jgi:ElaB/YqjD/DUF883 family membrane-anchored ribosome-binding protein
MGEIMESTANITSNSKPIVSDAVSAAHKSIDSASEMAHPAVDRLASGAHETVGQFAEVAESIGSKGEQLLAIQRRMIEGTRGYVRENPLLTLGIAVAASWLVGRIFGTLNSR